MSKLNSSLNFDDTCPFGRNKGKKISEIMDQDLAWLLWLRDQRASGNTDGTFASKPDEKFLSRGVLEEINKRIVTAKTEKVIRPSQVAKYEVWDVEKLDKIFGVGHPRIEVIASGAEKEPEPVFALKKQYGDEWGAF